MSSSTLLDNLIESLQVMPGVGPVSATRIAYYLLDRKRQEGLNMAQSSSRALKTFLYVLIAETIQTKKMSLVSFANLTNAEVQAVSV